MEIIKALWKETLLLKFGFSLLFGLLGLLGLLAVLAGVSAGVTFVPGWDSAYESVVTSMSVLVSGFVIAVAYWAALVCVNFAVK